MTRMLKALAFLVLAITAFSCVAAPQNNKVPLNVWNHKITVPTGDLTKLALGPESLHLKYMDGSILSVIVMDFASLQLPEDMSGPEFMAQVYGDHESETEMVAKTREVVFKDVHKSRVLQLSEGLTAYWLKYEDRTSVYIADKESDRFFLLLEGDETLIREAVKTITRR